MLNSKRKKTKDDFLFQIVTAVVYKTFSVARKNKSPIRNPTEGYNCIRNSFCRLHDLVIEGETDNKEMLKVSSAIAAEAIRFAIDLTMVGCNDSLKSSLDIEPD